MTGDKRPAGATGNQAHPWRNQKVFSTILIAVFNNFDSSTLQTQCTTDRLKPYRRKRPRKIRGGNPFRTKRRTKSRVRIPEGTRPAAIIHKGKRLPLITTRERTHRGEIPPSPVLVTSDKRIGKKPVFIIRKHKRPPGKYQQFGKHRVTFRAIQRPKSLVKRRGQQGEMKMRLCNGNVGMRKEIQVSG